MLSARNRIRDDGPMRLEITRRADLAVRALLVLHAREGKRIKGSELAAQLGTTPGFMPQALAPLVQAGWIRSDPGPSGGYVGAVDLGALDVLAVVEAVEGPTETGICVVRGSACGVGSPCALHTAWSRGRQVLIESLAATKLADLDVNAVLNDGPPESMPAP